MQVAKVNAQNNQTFGHSFRVSICLKEADGVTKFINPAEDKNEEKRTGGRKKAPATDSKEKEVKP